MDRGPFHHEKNIKPMAFHGGMSTTFPVEERPSTSPNASFALSRLTLAPTCGLIFPSSHHWMSCDDDAISMRGSWIR